MEPSNLHSISEISTDNLTKSEVTPEKLVIMKLRDSLHLHGREFDSEPGTPTGTHKSFDFSNGLDLGHSSRGRSSSLARSSRQVSTSTRRSSAFRSGSHIHSNNLSLELSRQAEGKFFALMDLVASASREASSLKEIWSGMIRERESSAREREELLEQVTEVTETLERKESEQHHHGHELGERKKQIETLLVDLSSALSTISEYKKKDADKDHQHLIIRKELHDLRDSLSRTSINHEKLKSDYEAIELRLRTSEDERDHAKRNSEQYQEELRTLTREHTELKSKSIETTYKLETTRKEVASFTDRLRTAETERDDYFVEKERLQELLRKANAKNDETALELSEITEKYDHQTRDINRFRETIRELETERDSFSHTVEHLRRELRSKSTAFEEIESRAAELTLKLEHLKRENTLTREKLSILEIERSEQQEIIEKTREESRLAILDKNQLRDDVEMWRHRHNDQQRLVSNLQESLRKTETTLLEARSEVHTLTERLSIAERERNEGRDKHDYYANEITHLKEKLVIVQAELRVTSEGRDRLREELHEYKQRYEEITETMNQYRDSSGGYEFEIESLRSMLHEAREQKERAITARSAADRERDEYIARYEEKCREMERWEQSASSHFHSLTKSEGRGGITSRVVSRSNTTGTAIHNGDRSESQHFEESHLDE